MDKDETMETTLQDAYSPNLTLYLFPNLGSLWLDGVCVGLVITGSHVNTSSFNITTNINSIRLCISLLQSRNPACPYFEHIQQSGLELNIT